MENFCERVDLDSRRRLRFRVCVVCAALLLLCGCAMYLNDIQNSGMSVDFSSILLSSPRPIVLPPWIKCSNDQGDGAGCFTVDDGKDAPDDENDEDDVIFFDSSHFILRR